MNLYTFTTVCKSQSGTTSLSSEIDDHRLNTSVSKEDGGGREGVVISWIFVAGFFLACDDFGRMFDNSFPACAFLLVCLFVCF